LFSDLFDRIHLLAVVLVLVVIALLLGGFIDRDDETFRSKRDPSVERAMQERARATFLLETYQPVDQMIVDKRYAEALLKLQVFEKTYPGEPHSMILRGSILVAQGVLGEGISQYAAAVKVNGDYVDEKSSLNRRDEITSLVENALPKIKESLRSTVTPSSEQSLRNLYYLQSRLAGGCE
jgi:hypothetical protein